MKNLLVTRTPVATGLESLFDDFFGASNFFRSPSDTVEKTVLRPRVDILEDDKHIELTFELPGMEKDEIKVFVKDNVLTVSADRKIEKNESENGWIHREIRSGSFSRSFTLPDTIDASSISADYRNGMLEVKLDRKEEAKPKEIEVKVK